MKSQTRVAVELLFLEAEWNALDWRSTAASNDLRARALRVFKWLVQGGAEAPGVSAARDGSSITASFSAHRESIRVMVQRDGHRLFVERMNAEVEIPLGDNAESTLLGAAAGALGLSGMDMVDPLSWASGRDYARDESLKAKAEAVEVRP